MFFGAFKIMQGNRNGHDCIEDAFKNFATLPIKNGWVGHQVTDVAQKQKRTTV